MTYLGLSYSYQKCDNHPNFRPRVSVQKSTISGGTFPTVFLMGEKTKKKVFAYFVTFDINGNCVYHIILNTVIITKNIVSSTAILERMSVCSFIDPRTSIGSSFQPEFIGFENHRLECFICRQGSYFGPANGEFRRPKDSKKIEFAGLENLFAGR